MARRLFTAEDGYSAADLLQYARDHLYSAGLLYPQGARCLDSASCLSHVGLELLLKAVLLERKHSFPDEHHLTKLCEAIQSAAPELDLEPGFARILPLLDQLFLARYPTLDRQPAVAQGDWPVIQDLARQIEAWLSDETRATLNSDQILSKGGRGLTEFRKG